MNLHSNYPFWFIRSGILNSFKKLESNLSCDVVIVGGGVTSSLIAKKLHEDGLDIVVLEKDHIGQGSTSASTALLQYEIDKPLFKLSKVVGDKNAVKAYKLCEESINIIEDIALKYEGGCEFKKMNSLLYSSFSHHVDEIIIPEFNKRLEEGFDVKLLDENQILENFNFKAQKAILSKSAAQINPYKLTHNIFKELLNKGAKIYEDTLVTEVVDEDNYKKVLTNDGYEIKTKYVIYACGYETQKILPKKFSELNSTYAIVTKPLDENQNYNFETLIWESKTPYLYIRSTNDRRIILGGLDEKFIDEKQRDKLISYKSLLLQNELKSLFPELKFQIDYKWAGVFGETSDGLPYLGSYDDDKILYTMAYGGNGITFSVIAANLFSDIINKRKYENIFSFDRKTT